jgi:hypothetical protein
VGYLRVSRSSPTGRYADHPPRRLLRLKQLQFDRKQISPFGHHAIIRIQNAEIDP